MKIYFLARIESYEDNVYQPLFSSGSKFKSEKQTALLEKIAFPTEWDLKENLGQKEEEFIDNCLEKNEDCGCYEENVKCKKPRGGRNRLFSPEVISKLVGQLKENIIPPTDLTHFIFDLDGNIVKYLELSDGVSEGETLTHKIHKKELYQLLKQNENIDFKTDGGQEEIDSIFIGDTINDRINTIDQHSPQLGIIFGEWNEVEQLEQGGGSKKKTIRRKIKRSKKVSKGGRKTKSKKNKKRSKSRKTKRSQKN